MKRIVVMTVGKTHSGKTTFAKALEQHLPNSLVIDQDNHTDFINTHYRTLLPKQGPNTIKYAITRTIVNYAVHETDFHLILCNANRSRRGRLAMLERFRQDGFISVLVHLDIPDSILQARIANSQRSTAIFRTAANFAEVLHRQNAEAHHSDMTEPAEDEADYMFTIKDSHEVHSVIQKIVHITQSL